MTSKLDYNCPKLTVDIIIEVPRPKTNVYEQHIVLINRKNAPYGWGLPGGFVNYGEPVYRAAIREAKEETSLDVELVEQFHVYSKPTRDDRVHAACVVFIAKAEGTPVAKDDAKEARIVPISTAKLWARVFDHNLMIYDYDRYKILGKRPDWRR